MNEDTENDLMQEEMNPQKEKPICKLTGTDGNVFAIIRKVLETLERAGMRDKATEFRTKVFKSHSYDAVLQLCFDYVEVE